MPPSPTAIASSAESNSFCNGNAPFKNGPSKRGFVNFVFLDPYLILITVNVPKYDNGKTMTKQRIAERSEETLILRDTSEMLKWQRPRNSHLLTRRLYCACKKIGSHLQHRVYLVPEFALGFVSLQRQFMPLQPRPRSRNSSPPSNPLRPTSLWTIQTMF
jgi:hypothetical protein